MENNYFLSISGNVKYRLKNLAKITYLIAKDSSKFFTRLIMIRISIRKLFLMIYYDLHLKKLFRYYFSMT